MQAVPVGPDEEGRQLRRLSVLFGPALGAGADRRHGPDCGCSQFGNQCRVDRIRPHPHGDSARGEYGSRADNGRAAEHAIARFGANRPLRAASHVGARWTQRGDSACAELRSPLGVTAAGRIDCRGSNGQSNRRRASRQSLASGDCQRVDDVAAAACRSGSCPIRICLIGYKLVSWRAGARRWHTRANRLGRTGIRPRHPIGRPPNNTRATKRAREPACHPSPSKGCEVHRHRGGSIRSQVS